MGTDGDAGTWKDLFSAGASAYARFRPRYPAALFAWLARESPAQHLAMDVGTGNGQAAVALAAHFARVIGVEPSAAQLQEAAQHERVSYRQGPAEALPLETEGAASAELADLILAAQAFHWFKADEFFEQARRRLKPGGLLALVSYGLSTVTPAVDAVVMELYETRLGRFWEPERRLVERGYAGIVPGFAAAPEHQLQAPPLAMELSLRCEDFIGYLTTWSALTRCRRETGSNPLAELTPRLQAAWAEGSHGNEARVVTWPLSVRAFRLPVSAGACLD